MKNIKARKIPYHLALLLLTSGASLILGFLSFGGMLVLWPVLPLAFAAFGLSVAYEGEIYLQNIKGALHKLFKSHHLERQLANDYLLNHFPDTNKPNCPDFFKLYMAQLHLLHRTRDKRMERTLRDMEKWFAVQLFHSSQDATPYAQALRQWLAQEGDQAAWQARLVQRRFTFQGAKFFSLFAGGFMGLGTTYLLVEAFTTIPVLAALSMTTWALLIVPMAAIAGAAYGLLTYNAVTDMISNDTLRHWYHKLRKDWREQGASMRNVFMAITTLSLLALAIGLTICTAGTWWTVAKEARPLFAWMGNLPSFIMGVINPLITGFSAIVFNLQNTSESLDMIDQETRKGNPFTRLAQYLSKKFNQLKQRENTLQIINPFRLLLTLTIAPLRMLLFLGHLVSIGVTADRVPGVSQIFSALLGIISEGFEDAHYFLGHDHAAHHKDANPAQSDLLKDRLGHEHGHNHNMDLPTRLLKFLFSPVYLLAATWDWLSSQLNSTPRHSLTLNLAWKKQMGLKKDKSVSSSEEASNASLEKPLNAWRMEQVLYRIDKHQEKHLTSIYVGRAVADEKKKALHALRDIVSREDVHALEEQIKEKASVYNQHRLFQHGTTRTSAFVQELPELLGGKTVVPRI